MLLFIISLYRCPETEAAVFVVLYYCSFVYCKSCMVNFVEF